MALSYDLTKIKNTDINCWNFILPEQLQKEEQERKELKKKGIINVGMFSPERQTCEDGQIREMNNQTSMLIFALGLSVGINEITKKNYKQVYFRIALMEKLNGAFLYRVYTKEVGGRTITSRKGFKFTLNAIKRNIGLKTNGSQFSKTDFLKRQVLTKYKI